MRKNRGLDSVAADPQSGLFRARIARWIRCSHNAVRGGVPHPTVGVAIPFGEANTRHRLGGARSLCSPAVELPLLLLSRYPMPRCRPLNA